MRKRLTAFALALIIMLNLLLFAGCKGKDNTLENTEEYITRGQWVAMLAEAFALDTYREATPYYTDIDNHHELFQSVQATSEWGFLSIYQDSTLDADTPATRAEVASTAAFAAGFKPKESSFDENNQFVSEPSIEYAIAHSIIENKDLSGFMTEEECESVIERAKEVYLNGGGEDKASVVYNENLIDLKNVTPNSIEVAENSVTFLGNTTAGVTQDSTGTLTASIQTEDGIVQVHVGDVFVTLPAENGQTEVAYKVVSIEETDRGITFTTETPTLGDLYDELVLHTTLVLDESCITWAEGVTVSPPSPTSLTRRGQAGEHQIQLLSDYSEEKPIKADYLSNRTSGIDSLKYQNTWKIELGNGEIKLSGDDISSFLEPSGALEALENSNFIYQDVPDISDFSEPDAPDPSHFPRPDTSDSPHSTSSDAPDSSDSPVSDTSWSKELDSEEKFAEGHYKIEGSISLGIEVTPDIEYHKRNLLGLETPWPESASMAVKSNIVTDLTVKGDLSGKTKLCEISIPTPIAGLTVDGTLFLAADLNGSVQAEIEFENINRVEWQTPLNFRHLPGKNTATPNVEALVELSFGPSVSLSLCALSVDIISAELTTTANVATKGTLEGECKEYIQDGVTMRDYTESIRLKSDLYLPIISLTASGPEYLADTFDLKETWELVKQEEALAFPLWNKAYPFWQMTVTLGPDGEIVDPMDTLLSDLQSGDFSAFAGTYTALTEYNQGYGITSCPDITLNADGSITGGYLTFSWGDTQEYAGTPPTSVVRGDDNGWGEGTFQCFVATYYNEGFEQNEYYIIFPAGTLDNTNATYISYIFAGGGIMDIRYTKVD